MTQKLAKALNNFLEPIRERRRYFEAHMDEVRDALATGSAYSREVAQATMADVREAMQTNYVG